MFRIPSKSIAFVLGLSLGIAGTGIAAGVAGSSIFPDVKQGLYYDQAIGEMYRAGIITGYANGKFGPDDFVTRGQVAVMMQRLRVELGVAEEEGSSRSSRSRDDDEEESSSSSSRSSSSSSLAAATPQGALRFTLASYSVDEDESSITISVVRTSGNQGAITVQYETQDDTAKAGEDYVKTTGTLNFINQGTSATFTVPITNDTVSDASEKFKVVLKTPTGGATLGSPVTADVTINDDETGGGSSTGGSTSSNPSGVLGFGALEYSVVESSGIINVTVNRTQGTQGTVTVQYATSDGTAKGGTEFSSTNGTLSFAAGETAKTFPVAVNDDSAIDGNRIFTVRLTNPTNLAILGTSTATVTIVDNEAGTFGSGSLRFSKLEFEGLETDTQAVITVLRQTGTSGTVTVQYATSNGTAQAGQDYTATSGTMTFLPGEASKTFMIPLTKDTVSDTEETLNVALSSPTGGAVLNSPSTATVKLFD